MGTRADFYVGIGTGAEWLGSIAFDGYRIDEMKKDDAGRTPDYAACWAIKTATNVDDYRKAVADLLSMNDDATLPDQGWPWPWKDSRTSDYAYCFDGETKVFIFGRPKDGPENGPKSEFPDMTSQQNVTYGHRSGMMLIASRG